jgi:hypothetical protein
MWCRDNDDDDDDSTQVKILWARTYRAGFELGLRARVTAQNLRLTEEAANRK